MCDPVTLAVTTFMVGAGQSVASYGAAKQQAAAQDQYYADNKSNAEFSAMYEHQQLDKRVVQEQDAYGEKLFDTGLETRARAAKAEAGAADAGISGLSVDALVSDIWGAGNRASTRIQANEDMTLDQLAQENLGVEARKNDRINSVKHGVQPSGLSLGLGIGTAGLNAETSYLKMTK